LFLQAPEACDQFIIRRALKSVIDIVRIWRPNHPADLSRSGFEMEPGHRGFQGVRFSLSGSHLQHRDVPDGSSIRGLSDADTD
jgi:hypothetical protein